MLKENDYIIRTWPSGHKTLGQVQSGLFLALETYNKEGGVKSGSRYGTVINGYNKTPYYLASEKEIKQGYCDQELQYEIC